MRMKLLSRMPKYLRYLVIFLCMILLLLMVKKETVSEKFSSHQVIKNPLHNTSSTSIFKYFAKVLKDQVGEDEEILNIISTAATSGKVIGSEQVRTFSEQKLLFTNAENLEIEEGIVEADGDCKKWGVATTIFSPPSESIRRFLYRPEWCLVIVGDKKLPEKEFFLETSANNRIFYLSCDDQDLIDLEFAKNVPWNSFARKNIGYLYAIAKGAKVIFDFDDDNMIKFWIPEASPDSSLDIDNIVENVTDHEVTMPLHDIKNGVGISFNPYPHLRPPSLPSWPRGLPLTHILNGQDNFKVIDTDEKPVFGVLQSLADYQPDVDAIYRLTQKTPFFFKRPNSDNTIRKILAVPSPTMTPYNAQATIHFYNSFWALLLPSTVHGRVSDIYRSFFAQKLFPLCGISLGFLPRPIVMQDRNPHSHLADFQAELDLYLKADGLVEYLLTINKGYDAKTLPEAIEKLWVDMYERGYIEEKDVILVQQWMAALIKIGYKFPSCGMTSVHKATPLAQHNVFKGLGRKINHLHDAYDGDPVGDCKNSIPNLSQRVFLAADVHSGPRVDVASILLTLGTKFLKFRNVGRDIDNNYPEIMKMPGAHSINDLSLPVRKYGDHSTKLRSSWMQMNYDYYKDKHYIKAVDAIVCSFPASMCQLWEPFNKSIVFWPAHRYNLGRCTLKEWAELNEYIYRLHEDKLHGHVIAAASIYDKEYLQYYTGIQPVLLSSFGGFYFNRDAYNQIQNGSRGERRKEILLFENPYAKPEEWDIYVQEALGQEFEVINVYQMYKHYTVSDLAKHRAVIMMPYSVMSYRHTELYAMGMPIFVPSIKFFRQRSEKFSNDRTSTTKPYCSRVPDLREQFEQFNSEVVSSKHPYSPNAEAWDDLEAETYWLQMADFYYWPHHYIYDSLDHLLELLRSANFQETSRKITMEMTLREKQVVEGWCEVIRKVSVANELP